MRDLVRSLHQTANFINVDYDDRDHVPVLGGYPFLDNGLDRHNGDHRNVCRAIVHDSLDFENVPVSTFHV